MKWTYLSPRTEEIKMFKFKKISAKKRKFTHFCVLPDLLTYFDNDSKNIIMSFYGDPLLNLRREFHLSLVKAQTEARIFYEELHQRQWMVYEAQRDFNRLRSFVQSPRITRPKFVFNYAYKYVVLRKRTKERRIKLLAFS